MLSSFSIPSLLLLGSGTLAATVSKKLTIGNAELSPDGFKRTGVTVNGQFPGPLITANVGDTFELTVADDLKDESLALVTSVHWHGFFQHGTNEMDGVATVNQCPIVPGKEFTYKFDVTDQAGTYWYHSHYSTQYCDGLRGPLVVYDPHDPHKHLYEVDNEETIITLSDWYHFASPQAPAIVYFNSTLINGKGRYIDPVGENLGHDLAVINVEYGTKYRMRLISMSCDPNFIFSIDNHDMTVIEADGSNVEPLKVDSIQIYAGQRYSFVLDANQKPDNYWIHALPQSSSNNPNATTFEHGLNSAILRYKGAHDEEPHAKDNATTPSRLPLVETNLHPLVPTPPPQVADKTIPLQISLNGSFFVNNHTYTPPETPVLLQILGGNKTAQSLVPEGSIYELEPNTVVDLIIPGGSLGGPHPMHLHGHQFWVLRSAGNSSLNLVDPVLRDVVSAGNSTDDEVTIRFKTDNAGPWILHCHIDWHLNNGLAVVMAENIDQAASSNPVPSSWDALCPAYDEFVAEHPNAY
ncbi:unnamed protein product [Peniophora sp. CBMAI 1063]|nr:unnamed protein product [Peniophora sp. CBMAI 1063]